MRESVALSRPTSSAKETERRVLCDLGEVGGDAVEEGRGSSESDCRDLGLSIGAGVDLGEAIAAMPRVVALFLAVREKHIILQLLNAQLKLFVLCAASSERWRKNWQDVLSRNISADLDLRLDRPRSSPSSHSTSSRRLELGFMLNSCNFVRRLSEDTSSNRSTAIDPVETW